VHNTQNAASMHALIVGDRVEGRQIVDRRLADAGFLVSVAKDGVEAFEAFLCDEPDVVVTDWQMPRLNGIGLLRRIREISDVPVVVMAGFGSIPDCEEAMRIGASRYLQFRRDVDRIGSVARELVKESASSGRVFERRGKRDRAMTAHEARALARLELREALQRHLIECRGNIAEIARRMGKDRSTIRYHLRRHGMLELN
jgi:DNA-binding NtrC family response regulator